jgi:hypothetical protein
MTYYPKASVNAPERINESPASVASSYATNMTMVVKADAESILAYVGDELAGVATPQVVDGDTLFFLTISSDKAAELRFTTAEGQPLRPVNRKGYVRSVRYKANDHHGTLREPVLLAPMDDQQPVKILEDGQLYILMPDGTRYSATGKKVK